MSLLLDDEVALGNDSHYKKYIVAIERVLKQFEESTEWADLITCLVKLKKTLENYPQYQSIPKRISLTKRLAQCLNPGLPSGVHLETLKVYDTIFHIIDKRALQRDILFYSHGLLPLLPVAGLRVKPVLLTLYETYFLPLGNGLNSILTGFLIGLFSALEEGADYYNRIILLLDNLVNKTDEIYFYTCIWSAMHLVASVRYSAITFILNHFDKRKTLDDQMYLIGLSSDTMVSAICACLYDNEQSLVQRSVLDFLLICLPIHKKQLTKVNMIKIIKMTFHILLKHDAGLNRRIYDWFLGTNELDNNNQQYQLNDSESYFIMYTQEILIESLRDLLEIISKKSVSNIAKSENHDNKIMTNSTDTLSSSWTFTKSIQVLLVLIEKSDVGPNIIEYIFMKYLLLIYEEVYHPSQALISINAQRENNYSQTLKTFNLLLDTLEPYFIWDLLMKTFEMILYQQQDEKLITAGCTIEQICGIIDMLLDIFLSELTTDTQVENLSEMLYRLINIMNNSMEKLTSNQIGLCIVLLTKIFKNITPVDKKHHLSIFRPSMDNSHKISDNDIEDENEQIIDIDNEYSTDIYNRLLRTDSIGKLQDPNVRIEQENLNDIERLLRQMQISINDKFQSIYSIIQTKTNDNLSIIFNRYQQLNEFHLKLTDKVNQYQTIFEDCCKLFIELYCFPRQFSNHDQSILSKGQTDFDDWFMDLFIISLCKSDNFSIQTVAISVLIELFGYTLSSYSLNLEISNNFSLMPFLTQEQILLFINETDFFQYIIAYVWECLGDKYDREYIFRSSHILCILHSMLPNNLCEDLIYNQLLLTNMKQSENEIEIFETYKRFFRLWNATRHISNKINESLTKSFQHCLVFVLNTLKNSNNYCLKSLVQQWTYDCFIHGDMCQIFDILIIMLLHIDTTRINIQQFDPTIHKEFFLNQEKNSYDEKDLNSNSNHEKDNTNEITFSLAFNTEENDDEYFHNYGIEQEDTDEEKRIRAISCISPGETIYHVRSPPQTIKFPSFSSLSQPILSNFRSLSPPILSKSTKQRPPTMSHVLGRPSIQLETNSHLKQMFTSSTALSNSLHTHSVPNETIIDESSTSLVTDPVDCQYAYILLYTQPYDSKRIMLSLNIIESLIDFIPEQLIHSLLTTSNIQSASISIYNNKMHELFQKHCRLIEGKNSNISIEDSQEYQSYLCLLLNILLIYSYSYYPKYFDIQENSKIHTFSLLILTRICHNLSYIFSFQKIILCLFNRIYKKKSDLFQIKIIYDYNNEYLHEQLSKQYLKQLIRLLEEIILLENIISSIDNNLIYQPIVNQTIFLSTILQYLKQIHFIDNHRYIISLVVRILPHCGSALKTISVRVIEQICQNLCFIVQYYSQQEKKIKFKHLLSFDTFDYIIHLIQRLSYICNYCLGNTINNTQHFTETLCPQHWMKQLTTNSTDFSNARQAMLNKLPLILSSLLFIWKTLSIDQTNSIWLENNIKQIREIIIECVTLLTKSNGISFIHAIVKCWGEYKQQQKSSKDNIGEIQALITILMNINNFTINDMIYNINEFIRNQTTMSDKKKQNYMIWCLQFLLAYLEQQKNTSINYWSMLVIMFKEYLTQSVSPTVTFLMIGILSFYVKQLPSSIGKRDVKDLQDIIMKVLENCNTIVASSLEQSKWLRKNLHVRVAQSDSEPIKLPIIDSSNEIDNNNLTLDFDDPLQSTNFSLIALTILAEHAAKLLDIIYNLTDDKDRFIIPYLQNLVTNVMPYVRTHVLSNTPCYRAASTLLMNISQYSYTRKAWKKEVFEQLFDTGFFQVDLSTLRLWAIIIKNMIANGKTTSFHDVLNRINTIPIGLFSSKEYEQRSMLIKRFAFVIYASEKDEYNQYLPEILVCITDLLKLPQVPILYIQVFHFLRILLIRISSKNLISFWPIIMSELIQVLLQIEQDLLSDIDGNSRSYVQRMTTQEITLSNNPNLILKVYLYACKLLDILLAIPFSDIYQFQLFRSAFVDDHVKNYENSTLDTFITFSIRLSKLFEQKFQTIPIIQTSNFPLLRLRIISNISELFPFFNYLSKMHLYDNLYLKKDQIFLSDKTNAIETSILEDFLE
ncbi:unnamed protein product [Adineta steineri]|uniref:Dopey-like protein n=1 Tax=Adineta steineri TaxID=433720 RepID=A0A818LKZ1_9BILA|nr:unnamed protein product [Adineta steineri]